ncbi:hypothetical protein PLIIFM63780_003199 [Purpureocillium lilacinum]|nr:hypothetical protein PLIIFM63780_003199 [Purpureocillium lilacinum]
MLRTVTGLFAAAAVAVAVTPITDDAMTQLLNEGGVSLAMKAQPMFFFGQAMNRPPCIPTWATSGNQQTPSSPLCDYPDMGCNCVTPDKGIGNPSQRFPIYYSYSRCSDTMVRVAYNLFYTKDGAKPKGINGHPYDWERVLVELRKSDDTQWRPYQLHLSQHSGYDRILWPNIQNTFSDSDAGQPRGGDNGKKNLDHPKVYVAWSKHANYQDRNTGWNDPLSQLTNNAFRSQDWWYFPTRDDYIRADRSTDVGRLIASLDWAQYQSTSTPTMVREIKSSAELKEVFASNTYVAVDFFADWCPPCKAISPVFEQLSGKHAVEGQLAFVKVNVDNVKELAVQYRITAMPTFLFFKDGTQVAVHGQKMVQGANPPVLTAAAEKLGGLARKRAEEAAAK